MQPATIPSRNPPLEENCICNVQTPKALPVIRRPCRLVRGGVPLVHDNDREIYVDLFPCSFRQRQRPRNQRQRPRNLRRPFPFVENYVVVVVAGKPLPCPSPVPPRGVCVGCVWEGGGGCPGGGGFSEGDTFSTCLPYFVLLGHVLPFFVLFCGTLSYVIIFFAPKEAKHGPGSLPRTP